MKAMKKVSLFLIVAIFLSLFSGCSDTSYIMKSGNKKYPVAPYAYYVNYLRDTWEIQAATYYKTKLENIINSNADSNGMKIYEYIIEQAKDNYMTYVYVNSKFEEYGLSLSDEDKKSVDEIYSSFDEKLGEDGIKNLKKTLKMTEEELKDLMAVNYKSNAIINYNFGEGGEKEITESEILSTYKDIYARFKYVVCYGKDLETGEDLTLDEKNDKKNKINEAYGKLKNGEATIEELIPEYSDDYLKTDDKSTDEEKNNAEIQNKRIIEDGVITNESGVFDSAVYQQYGFTLESQVATALFKLKEGEYTIVEVGTDSFWLIQRIDPLEKEDYFEDKRKDVFNYMTQDDLTNMYSEWLNGFAHEFNEDTVNKYDPRNLKPLFVKEEEIQELLDSAGSSTNGTTAPTETTK